MERYRDWCFTWNGIPEHIPRDRIPESLLCAKYVICQLERGENGNIHFQGTAIFSTLKSIGQMVKLCPGAHWEPARSIANSVKYCEKEESRIDGPWEHGERPKGQGNRSDIESFRTDVLAGMCDRDLARNHFAFMLRYPNGVKNIRLTLGIDRTKFSQTLVFYGPPGSGKSFHARLLASHGTGNYYMVPMPKRGEKLWFDGYDGEPTIIIEDFNGEVARSVLLRLFDESPMSLPVKGSHVSLRNGSFIVTANSHPLQWYSNIGLGPLERRLAEPFGRIEYMGLGPNANSPFAGMSELEYLNAIGNTSLTAVPIMRAPGANDRIVPRVLAWPPVEPSVAVDGSSEDEMEESIDDDDLSQHEFMERHADVIEL